MKSTDTVIKNTLTSLKSLVADLQAVSDQNDIDNAPAFGDHSSKTVTPAGITDNNTVSDTTNDESEDAEAGDGTGEKRLTKKQAKEAAKAAEAEDAAKTSGKTS